MEEGASDDAKIKSQGPVLAVFDVGGYSLTNFHFVVDRAAEAAHLGEPREPWLHRLAQRILMACE